MIKDLRFDEKEQRHIGTLEGELDVFSAPKLIKNIENALEQKKGGVLFNCENLTYIDSMGLGAMVKIHKIVEKAGYNVRLADVKPRIVKLFAITDLMGMFGLEREDT